MCNTALKQVGVLAYYLEDHWQALNRLFITGEMNMDMSTSVTLLYKRLMN